jgi:hypothetical protein
MAWSLSAAALAPALGIETSGAAQSDMLLTIGAVYIVSLIHTSVLSLAALRSDRRGWRLAGMVFLLYFGISAFLSQIETWYFNDALEIPAREIWFYVFVSLIQATIVAGAMAWMFRTKGVSESAPDSRLVSPANLALRSVLIAAVVYPALYFLFGYFILWRTPEARLLYSGSLAILPFAEHMRLTFSSDPWLYPWQILRGFVWILLALPFLRSSHAGRLETAVLTGLLFALLMNAQHLIPNPYMPPPVQRAHFVETASSNFILGLVVAGWLLRPSAPPAAARAQAG